MEAEEEAATKMQGGVPEGGPLDKWIKWATRRANRLDPPGEGARTPRERTTNPFAPSTEKDKATSSVDIVWERLSQSVGPRDEAWRGRVTSRL
jgi:hypothetical protein